MIFDWEAGLRLVVSVILAGFIGYERQARHKSAGLRTHILVGIGSCLIMLLSYKTYYDVQGVTNADPARLAAQVVSGIGFLGAGSIMKDGPTVKGLTTAATLWVVAGVGLAIGAGYYAGGIMTTALVLLTLTLLERMGKYIDKKQLITLNITASDAPDQANKVSNVLCKCGIKIYDVKTVQQEDFAQITLDIRVSDSIDINEVIYSLSNIPGIVGVAREG